MIKFPISFVFMTSTKGHWGFKSIWQDTLNHWARHLPLDSYSIKVAHIKVSPDEIELGDIMGRELEGRGFKVIKTVAPWKRGISHQNEYAKDQIRVSKELSLYDNPVLLYVEDDSPVVISDGSTLDRKLSDMCTALANPDVLSVRFMRENDLPPAGAHQDIDAQWFRHEHINFQPLIMRTNQFYTMMKMAEDNLSRAYQVQIEMLWRLILAPYSRDQLPHLVLKPHIARTIHLGTPDYPALKSSLGLS